MNRRRFIVASAASTLAGALAGNSIPAEARPLDAALPGLYCVLEHSDGRESREALTMSESRRRKASFAIERSTKIDAIHFGIYERSFRRFERLSIAGPFELRRGDAVDVSYFCGALWVASYSLAKISCFNGQEPSADSCVGREHRTNRPLPSSIV